MRYLGHFLLTFLVMLPSLALAHGPTRQKLALSVDVAAAPEAVWAVIGNFQDMSWHPAVSSTTGEGGNALEATRVLTLKAASGPTISEVLYKYDAAKMSYSYRITKVDVEVLPVTNYSGHLTVTPNAGGGSHIEWKGAFYRGYPNNDPPANLNDEAALAAVGAVYKAGLDALEKKFGK
ncbi:SRPBCC family protein [Sinorhizobium sp. 7-81]|uniref:SRPBCC family protein n=1 Tax=Sinorhizobium sp. 8-89 TaxID=3049089 RepID=UPI0024C32C99|nr:SRPBCC family protein [Sinorhizobium sp. 8-89]MDK1492514.1 SRPBCC family protein [Sinorhizobium sp. 8-89]